MPRLSDTKIRNAQSRGRPYKLFDMEGLFLFVSPSGGRLWRQRYRFAGKERLASLGSYPEVSLATARDRARDLRKLLAEGRDPAQEKRAEENRRVAARNSSLKSVALDWHGKFKVQWSEHHGSRVLQRLETNVFPWIGSKPIRDVSSADVLECMDRMAQRGAIDTARRVLQILKKIFKWAIGRGLIVASPAAHIEPKDQLPSVSVEHRAAIKNPEQLGMLLKSIDQYQGSFVVKCALKVLAFTFVRPGELRLAQWPEFNLAEETPTWRIPAARMKMGGADHLVPLSRQTVQVLKELQPLTGGDNVGLLFPSVRNASRPLSENTLNAVLRTMGFNQQQHTSHGFRSSASTLLNEQQWNKDAIELQLSHMQRDKTRASYNSADHLPLRRRMMQSWADYLDSLHRTAV